jgi:hypothetical protein
MLACLMLVTSVVRHKLARIVALCGSFKLKWSRPGLEVGVKISSGWFILFDICFKKLKMKVVIFEIKHVKINMVNIQISFTKTNTNVLLKFKENMNMKNIRI